MKIRNRLSFVFTLAAAIVLCLVSLAIHYSASTFRADSFYQRLEERMRITEQLFLEKDNLSDEVYQDIREKFLHTLPDEVEIVTLANHESIQSSDSLAVLPKSFIGQIVERGSARFQTADQQGVGQVYTRNGASYAVIVVASDAHGIAYVDNLTRMLLLFGVVSVLLMFLVSRMFAGHALKPISKKIRQAQNIGASNLYERLPVLNKNDELGHLTITFNDLLDRLEKAFETQKNFVRNASHEIRNPLTTIIGEAEVSIEKERTNAEYVASMQLIIHEAERLNALVNRFLELSRVDATDSPSQQEAVRLDEVLLQAKAEVDQLIPENQIQIDFSGLPEDSDKLVVIGSQDLLKVAFSNVLDNASKFSDHRAVKVFLRCAEGAIVVQVKDQGIGIPDTDQPKIFEPLYRGSNAIKFKGSGIGLSLTQRIVNMHRGEVKLESNTSGGTTVMLSFPTS